MEFTFEKVKFGYADAGKELKEYPEIFDKAFYDPHNYLDQLINGGKFIICGRKGTGKTAYSSKIEHLSNTDSSIVALKCPLNDFDYEKFTQFSNNTVSGGKKYSGVWKYLLLLEFMKIVELKNYPIENEQYNIISDTLKRFGILSDENLLHSIKCIEKKGLKLEIKNWVDFGGISSEKELCLNGPEEITFILLKVLKKLYFGTTKFFLIIDGLDESLRGHRFQADEITGLIRAANELNNQFSDTTLNYKIIVLLRDDIIDICRDPDLTKIRRDSEINLTWRVDSLNPYYCELSEIVMERISLTHKSESNFASIWTKMFPSRYMHMDSLLYVFQNTLNRPRDILQFFIECQKQYPQNYRINYSEFNNILSGYSADYFIPSMQDELTGFWPDETICELPVALSKIGNRVFDVESFKNNISDIPSFQDVDPQKMLNHLFDCGYIGQLRKRPEHKSNPYSKGSFNAFKYINKRERFESKDPCYLHRGLVKGLNL